VTLLKAASTVSLMTLASRVTGLVRDLLMAATFGATALTDAFNVAFRIPGNAMARRRPTGWSTASPPCWSGCCW